MEPELYTSQPGRARQDVFIETENYADGTVGTAPIYDRIPIAADGGVVGEVEAGGAGKWPGRPFIEAEAGKAIIICRQTTDKNQNSPIFQDVDP